LPRPLSKKSEQLEDCSSTKLVKKRKMNRGNEWREKKCQESYRQSFNAQQQKIKTPKIKTPFQTGVFDIAITVVVMI
jgi:hypothetical protein